jgi:hypothetical protein
MTAGDAAEVVNDGFEIDPSVSAYQQVLVVAVHAHIPFDSIEPGTTAQPTHMGYTIVFDAKTGREFFAALGFEADLS